MVDAFDPRTLAEDVAFFGRLRDDDSSLFDGSEEGFPLVSGTLAVAVRRKATLGELVTLLRPPAGV